MTATDLHPLVPDDQKSVYVVRDGHSLPMGSSRVFASGSKVLADDSWVASKAKHILAPAKEAETVPTSSGQGRSKGMKVGRTK